MSVAWSKFDCPYCGVPSAIHEDMQSMVQFLAHGEIDLFCWLPEWEPRWGRPELQEVYAQFHGGHAVFPEPMVVPPIQWLDENPTSAPN